MSSVTKPAIVTIGDYEFMIHRLDAFEALAIFGDLQRDLLPALGGLLGAAFSEEAPTEGTEAAAFQDALKALSEKLDGKQLTEWVSRLITKDSVSVTLNGNDVGLSKEIRALVFTDFTDILELLVHVLKVNFAGPLSGFLNRFGMDLAQFKTAK